VYSFVGETTAVHQFSRALQSTLKLGYQGGFAKGVGMGITYSVLFCCWALLLWYGGKLVREGEANGGKALSTIFAVVVGGMCVINFFPIVPIWVVVHQEIQI
jgi:ATP-binding cassette subfamily B (MDR/TAP) protein 1